MRRAEELWRDAVKSPKAGSETREAFWERVAHEMLDHVEVLVAENERWRSATGVEGPDEVSEWCKAIEEDAYNRGYEDRKDEEGDK